MPTPEPVLETASGKVRGRQLPSGVFRFAGIPFAEAPVNELRWKEPVPKKAWEGVKDAREFGPAAIQFGTFTRRNANNREPLPESEDCLFVNVWTPDTVAGRNLPVMVFVHGGAWLLGSGRHHWADGEEFVKNGEVVYVNLQYRLGPLGWLDLEEVGGEEYAQTKNLGLLDLLEGLKWVQANIQSFGGDPDNVTLFGQSAGSVNVMALFTMAKAKGLYHKVIAQSGVYGFTPPPAIAKENGKQFLKYAGTESMEELQALSVTELQALSDKMTGKAGTKASLLHGPVFDGDLLPEDPWTFLAAGKRAGIPVMSGTCEDEINLWLEVVPIIRKFPGMAGRAIVKSFGQTWKTLKPLRKQIKEDHPDMKRVYRISRMITLMAFRKPHQVLSNLQSVHAPTYLYRFDWQDPVKGLKAYHSLELPVVFNQVDQPALGPNPDLNLMKAMHQAWISFAKTGNPNHPDLSPAWPEYSRTAPQVMIFNSENSILENPEAEVLKIWGELYKKSKEYKK